MDPFIGAALNLLNLNHKEDNINRYRNIDKQIVYKQITMNRRIAYENNLLFIIIFFQSGPNDSSVFHSPETVATKPVPPPRDHLKIEKDGRIINRAPAPQLPARITNNNITSPINNATSAVKPPQVVEPTKEQLDSINKYQVRDFTILTKIKIPVGRDIVALNLGINNRSGIPIPFKIDAVY